VNINQWYGIAVSKVKKEKSMNVFNSETDRNIVIVRDARTGLLGAVVCPTEEFCSVVFENGEWIHFAESETSPISRTLKTDRTMADLVKVGEAVYARPQIPPGKIPDDAQQKYVEAALGAINDFRQRYVEAAPPEH
jgi:hypothetical protein